MSKTGSYDTKDTLQNFYESKESAYFGNARVDYIDALPSNSSASILELGCGNGATGELALKLGKCGRYVGIELFEPMALQAARTLTTVHQGNIECMDLPYADGSFDALIMSEVLEHLVAPEIVLQRLVRKVRPGGRVFASSPNVAHWRVVWHLIHGRFDYADSGVMDRTHLRWFTPRSFGKMFEDAGVVIDQLGPLGGRSRQARIILALFSQRFAHLFGKQINLIGHRSN